MNKPLKNTMGKTLVAGAGLSGIRSALDLAQTGYQVLLVDSADHMGGLVCRLDYQFPTSTCGYCRSLPMFDRDKSSQHCLRKGLAHENIEILLSTELISVEGEPGDFTVTLKQKPSLVDPSLCTGCGECEPVCPVLVDDPFNEGLTRRKAIYLPSPQSLPNAWTIDYTVCTRCGECERICPVKAVKLTDQDREKFKILVVDDEKIVRDSMKEWLKEEGFSVKTADSGWSALELMEAGPFNMVLTDIKMPGMDGVELLAKAKQINPEICVIMMTAYAAVDSAVEAMKQGALDYLTKPFDPDVLVSMVLKVYHEFEIAEALVERVDALILSTGTRFFQPELGKNPYGYGVLPGVITAMEFERLISGTGPGTKAGPGIESGMTRAELIHPSTKKPVKRIAWFQCVGSRDVQANAGFCSTVCCMISIKEAILARQKFGPDIETTIFYMDMRTLGKTSDMYRQKAEQENGVRFVRARVHSLAHEPSHHTGSLKARYVDMAGKEHDDGFDLVVLATGQQPNMEMSALAAKNNLGVNSWGFINTQPFSMIETSTPGILAGGSLAGLKDISDSVTCASAAALGAY
jgi:heterodisulfide reductase subunit A